MKTWLAALSLVAAAQAAASEVHGQTDLFRGQGVALAWAVARGPDEARTFVVVRVVTDAAVRAVSVKGQDPFTKAERTWVESRPTPGIVDIRIPRAGFAEFPRSEWRFEGAGKEPRLVVFYLGVPDTTPEFDDREKLEAYLAARVR